MEEVSQAELIRAMQAVLESDKRMAKRMEAGDSIPDIDRIRLLEEHVATLTTAITYLLGKLAQD
jgi:hypothetical protein